MKKIIFLILLAIFAFQSEAYCDALDLLEQVDTYRVCDFRSYPYSIWSKVCWRFPLNVTEEIAGDFIAIENYLIDKKYISDLKDSFPLETIRQLILQHNPDKKYPKWRMPPKITVIVLLFDKKKEFLGSISIDINYDAFSINATKDYYFRFGDGSGADNVSKIIDAVSK